MAMELRCASSVRKVASQRRVFGVGSLLVLLLVAGCGQDSSVVDAGADGGCAAPCDDEVFCNGEETCLAGQCMAGTAPCAAAVCVEAESLCDTCDADNDGHDAIGCDGDDCDDASSSVHPDAPEICDTINNDCDGMIDEGVSLRCYVDGDDDGYALAEALRVEVCQCPSHTTDRPPSDASDCDDTLADVSPESPEICANTRDDDCDGTVDEAGNDWYRDCDGDGFGTGTAVRACASPGTPGGCPDGGHVLLDGDCDDDAATVFPDAPEICDARVNDCVGVSPDGEAATAWCNGPMAPPRAPNTAATCSSGGCAPAGCAAGYLDCTAAPGCEADGETNPNHCGACGNVCAGWSSNSACSDGRCAGVRDIDSYYQHTCALHESGSVYCWGDNEDGGIGDGTTTFRTVPTLVPGLTDAVEIGVGFQYACAVRASGALVCWGENYHAQLADGTRIDRPAPITVPNLTDIVEVAASTTHTCARRASGGVVCWGFNNSGELGIGTRGNILHFVPVAARGLTDAVELALGDRHTCARRASGAVVCWGRDLQGQLGNGAQSESWVPTPVEGLTDAVELTANYDHTCARRASGTVVCWGNNAEGQLGDGTRTNRTVPTPVSNLDDAVHISAGYRHVCATRATGAVVCWGLGADGRLGDGTETTRLAPTPVSGLVDAIECSAGTRYTCATRASGEVVCWGYNGTGQLGDGTTVSRLLPAAVVAP